MKMRTLVTLAVLFVIAGHVALSCPVCYGETDPHTASAVNAEVISLLFVVGAVLSFFVSLIFQIRKRTRLQAGNTTHEPH